MLIGSSSCDKLWTLSPLSNWTTIVLCTPTFCSCTCLFTARLHLQTSSLLHHGNEWPSQSNWIWTAVPHLEPSCLTQIMSSSSPLWSLVPPLDAEMPTWIELQPDVVLQLELVVACDGCRRPLGGVELWRKWWWRWLTGAGCTRSKLCRETWTYFSYDYN